MQGISHTAYGPLVYRLGKPGERKESCNISLKHNRPKHFTDAKVLLFVLKHHGLQGKSRNNSTSNKTDFSLCRKREGEDITEGIEVK
jgi:hypothetical protein